MIHLNTISNEEIIVHISDIILVKSVGFSKAMIYVKGLDSPINVVASFEEIKNAIISLNIKIQDASPESTIIKPSDEPPTKVA